MKNSADTRREIIRNVTVSHSKLEEIEYLVVCSLPDQTLINALHFLQGEVELINRPMVEEDMSILKNAPPRLANPIE
jgi:hypothetical protein